MRSRFVDGSGFTCASTVVLWRIAHYFVISIPGVDYNNSHRRSVRVRDNLVAVFLDLLGLPWIHSIVQRPKNYISACLRSIPLHICVCRKLRSGRRCVAAA